MQTPIRDRPCTFAHVPSQQRSADQFCGRKSNGRPPWCVLPGAADPEGAIEVPQTLHVSPAGNRRWSNPHLPRGARFSQRIMTDNRRILPVTHAEGLSLFVPRDTCEAQLSCRLLELLALKN